MRRGVLCLAVPVALGVALAACTTEAPPDREEAASPTASPSEPDPTPSPPLSPDSAPDGVPPLAAAPGGDSGLWLDTIGVPVVAAIRTSTPLARLDAVAPERRGAVCRQVATDLDGIAAPQVLSGLAITADAETATLLVGDLQAKGDLLAACARGGDDLEARIAEVERTHAVAVAWLAVLGEGQ